MKLLIVPALFLLALPAAPVRFESDGVRVGDEVVTGKTIGLKSAGPLPILVSGSAVENLSSTGSALEVAIGDKTILLDVGIRLDRQGESYRLSSHGPAFSLSADGRTLDAQGAAAFKISDKGFDFGALGTLEGSSLSAKIASKVAVQDPPQPEPPTTLRGRTRSQTSRPDGIMRRVFWNGDPTVTGEAADGHAIQMRVQVTPTGAP